MRQKQRSFQSFLIALDNSPQPTPVIVNLNGSATARRMKRNSKGPCSPDDASRRSNLVGPLLSHAQVRVAPKLKNPIRKPANTENQANKRRIVFADGVGVQRTFAKIIGYRNESKTVAELFAKISRTSAALPNTLTSLTGASSLTRSRAPTKVLKGWRVKIARAPVTDPRAKAVRVIANARSMNFMGLLSCGDSCGVVGGVDLGAG